MASFKIIFVSLCLISTVACGTEDYYENLSQEKPTSGEILEGFFHTIDALDGDGDLLVNGMKQNATGITDELNFGLLVCDYVGKLINKVFPNFGKILVTLEGGFDKIIYCIYGANGGDQPLQLSCDGLPSLKDNCTATANDLDWTSISQQLGFDQLQPIIDEYEQKNGDEIQYLQSDQLVMFKIFKKMVELCNKQSFNKIDINEATALCVSVLAVLAESYKEEGGEAIISFFVPLIDKLYTEENLLPFSSNAISISAYIEESKQCGCNSLWEAVTKKKNNIAQYVQI